MEKYFLQCWMALGGLSLLGVLLGCGGAGRPDVPLPPLHPVRGQLLRAGQPVAGGAVRFSPVSGQKTSSGAPADQGAQNLSIGGQVGPDGQFELTTLQTVSQRSALGAPVGQYTVTYYPPSETQDVQPIPLPTPVTIREGPNELKLSLDRPAAGKR